MSVDPLDDGHRKLSLIMTVSRGSADAAATKHQLLVKQARLFDRCKRLLDSHLDSGVLAQLHKSEQSSMTRDLADVQERLRLLDVTFADLEQNLYRALKMPENMDGITYSLEQLPAESAMVMLADNPELSESPVYCLSNYPTDTTRCAEPRADMLNDELVEIQRTAGAATGADVIDLTEYFCNTESCPPIIGDTLAYSDEHHMTATFSRQLAPALDEALSPLFSP